MTWWQILITVIGTYLLGVGSPALPGINKAVKLIPKAVRHRMGRILLFDDPRTLSVNPLPFKKMTNSN